MKLTAEVNGQFAVMEGHDKRNRSNLRRWDYSARRTSGVAEGTQLDVIVITNEKPRSKGNAAEILAEIAAMPLEEASDSFPGREHDSILYLKSPE